MLGREGWQGWAGRQARAIAEACGLRQGVRLLHVTDLHNRPAAVRLTRALCAHLAPDLVVNTGDLSGLGGPVEAVALRALAGLDCPMVFAPGNHDSDLTVRAMARMGAEVLVEPRLVTVAGVRIWGYRDPRRTRLLRPEGHPEPGRPPAAPPVGEPFLIAVHDLPMAEPIPAEAGLLLCGHVHHPEVRRLGSTLMVRPGAAGGANPWSGPIRLAVIDVALPEHQPAALWLVRVEGGDLMVEPVDM